MAWHRIRDSGETFLPIKIPYNMSIFQGLIQNESANVNSCNMVLVELPHNNNNQKDLMFDFDSVTLKR